MKEIKKLLEMLEERFPTRKSRRHSFSLCHGVAQDIDMMSDVNVMITINIEDSNMFTDDSKNYINIYFSDNELNYNAKTHFKNIIKMLEDENLIK